MQTCALCGRKITGKGNNPAPFSGDVCCNQCNDNAVVPLRAYLNGAQPKTLLTIEPNGVMIYVDVEEEEASLKELQTLVGGYIEVYPKDDDRFVFIVDEEGLLKDKEYNHLANQLFGIDVVGPLVVCPKELFK